MKMLTKLLTMLSVFVMLIILTPTQANSQTQDAELIPKPACPVMPQGKVCVDQIDVDTATKAFDEVVVLRKEVVELKDARKVDAAVIKATQEERDKLIKMWIDFIQEMIKNPPKNIKKNCLICT